MNIFVIGRSFPEKHNGMIGLFERQQALAISKYYHNTHYIYLDDRSIKINRKIKNINFKEDSLSIDGKMIPIRGLPNSAYLKIKSRLYIKFLNKLFQKYGLPDIIHIHFPLITLSEGVWNFLRKLDTKLIVTEHWTKVQTEEITNRQRLFLRKVYKEADSFICVSNDLKNSVQKICGNTREILVVPNMVSNVFCYKKRELNSDKFKFISVGRLTNVKRFDLLIDAFFNTFKDEENTTLTILGDGELKNKLQEKINFYNLTNQVFLEGFKTPTEVAAYFQESDCYVSASNLETFGVPAIEAWMTGLPVIIADNSPILHYLNNTNGLSFKVDNLDSLSDKMKFIKNHTSKFNTFNISEYSKKNFSEKSVALQLKNIYLDK